MPRPTKARATPATSARLGTLLWTSETRKGTITTDMAVMKADLEADV